MKKIEPGHRVIVVRDIVRKEGPYARRGETGVVTELFNVYDQKNTWNAKVRMDADDAIKTFRITSLQRVDASSVSAPWAPTSAFMFGHRRPPPVGVEAPAAVFVLHEPLGPTPAPPQPSTRKRERRKTT